MNPRTTTRTRIARTAVVVTAGAVLLGGGTAVALAQTGQPAPPSTSEQAEGDESGEATVRGSISVPEQAGEQDEAAEAQALAGLATVTPDQAVAAATAAEPGTAGAPHLGDEDGSLVYEIVVTRADGSAVEVKVDAGNAAVLASEPDDGEDAGGENEAAEGPENGEQQPETDDAGSTTGAPVPTR